MTYCNCREKKNKTTRHVGPYRVVKVDEGGFCTNCGHMTVAISNRIQHKFNSVHEVITGYDNGRYTYNEEQRNKQREVRHARELGKEVY